jgi:hypothetical protein
MCYFWARFRCDRSPRNMDFSVYHIDAVTLLYPISCRLLFCDVRNMVEAISAHSQIIPHRALQTAFRSQNFGQKSADLVIYLSIIRFLVLKIMQIFQCLQNRLYDFNNQSRSINYF